MQFESAACEAGLPDHSQAVQHGSCRPAGELIGSLLAGFWRNSQPPLPITAQELAVIAPLLLKSGGAASAWWRIRQTDLREMQIGRELQQAYRLHTLQAALKDREIAQVFSFLKARGLNPLLGKGWVIARQYPEPGLRPYGDIDLYVRQEEHGAFAAAIKESEANGWHIDLHRGAAELDDRSFDELYQHSQKFSLGEAEISAFGPEDHLRLLCLHFLREGALRPLWLCDIAIAVESLPPQFDWDYFLGGNQRRSDWAIGAIALAHQILGARIEELPLAERVRKIPGWVTATVIQQWGTGRVTNGLRRPMQDFLQNSSGLISALKLRWPNPIEATVHMNGFFNHWPRLPYQIGACVARASKFIAEVARFES